jgi:hypothetical protein
MPRPKNPKATSSQRSRVRAARKPRRAGPKPAPTFPAPVRAASAGDRLLAVFAAGHRDEGLDEFIAIMAGHGHSVLELAVTDPSAAAARTAIRAHTEVATGRIQGIVLLGRDVSPFPFQKRFDCGPLTDYSDLPFGSDFPYFDARDEAELVGEEIAARPEPYRQEQWVSRIFGLNRTFLDNLRATVPPQTNNLLIVNADPNSDEPAIQDRWRIRYGLLSAGQNVRFAFRGPDFATKELLPFLEDALANATFVSVTDHGNSTDLENLPGMRNGQPRLPPLPDVVELAACATGRWMDDASNPDIKGLAETALERGALAVIAPQCLLAWNFAKGSVGRPVNYNPVTDRFDQEIHNVAPWLDVWPREGSLGRAQAFAVTETLDFLRDSAYMDKGYIVHQVLCGHGLFGDGTVEFRSA